MSHADGIPPELAEWIVRSLDGTISPDEFAKLNRELATNEAALQYYLEFMAMSAGLVDQVGVLPKSLSGVSDAAAQEDESREPQPAVPNGDAAHGPLRFDATMSEEEKRRLIERYAQEQLEAFLRQEHPYELRQTCHSQGWDVWDAAHTVGHTVMRLVGVGVRTAKVAAVCMIMAAAVAIGYLAIRGDRTVATLVEAVDARQQRLCGARQAVESGRYGGRWQRIQHRCPRAGNRPRHRQHRDCRQRAE